MTRSDCKNAPRPCDHIACRYNIRVVELRAGGHRERGRPRLRCHHETIVTDGLPDSCALDIADRGGATLEYIGSLLRITRERVRQIEAKALRKIRQHPDVLQRLLLRQLWLEREEAMTQSGGEADLPRSPQWRTQARRAGV